MGFPTKNDHFGVFWGYHHLRKHPYISQEVSKLLVNGLQPSYQMGCMRVITHLLSLY